MSSHRRGRSHRVHQLILGAGNISTAYGMCVGVHLHIVIITLSPSIALPQANKQFWHAGHNKQKVENHWMSMLILRVTAYLRKGNSYGIKSELLIAMLSLCAKFMILLAALREIENTFLSNVSLMTMRFYLLMLKEFMFTLMLKSKRICCL